MSASENSNIVWIVFFQEKTITNSELNVIWKDISCNKLFDKETNGILIKSHPLPNYIS